MPAHGRQVHAARAHPKDRRHVFDQSGHAPSVARVGEEAQKALDLALVDPRAVRAPAASKLVRALRSEQMNRENRRTYAGREFCAALDAGARLVIQPVDADVRAARP